MAAADVGVVPKRAAGFGNEAFSTKILEFMACGVPVIVSRTQVDSYYFDDQLVRFFESENADDLAKAFVEQYEQRANQGDRIRAAQAFAIAHSWQERVTDYQKLVLSLVAVTAPGARAT
jgi:glycosyltransferase involved in cell wall biosynthesis